MILSVKTLEVEQKTFLINLIQLKAHLYLTPQTQRLVVMQYCTLSTAAAKLRTVLQFSTYIASILVPLINQKYHIYWNDWLTTQSAMPVK